MRSIKGPGPAGTAFDQDSATVLQRVGGLLEDRLEVATGVGLPVQEAINTGEAHHECKTGDGKDGALGVVTPGNGAQLESTDDEDDGQCGVEVGISAPGAERSEVH